MKRITIDHSLKVPLYFQLKEGIRRAIVRGQLNAGERFPSETELIRDYGLSYPTVTRALRELAQEGYLHRQWGKGTFVADFRGQAKARTMPVLPRQTIGLLSEFGADFLSDNVTIVEILNGMLAQSQKMGHEIVIIPQTCFKDSFDSVTGLCDGYGACILLGSGIWRNRLAREYFTANGKPFVIVCCELNDPSAFVINIREEQAPTMAVEHLRGKGHERIAFVTGDGNWGSSLQYRGFCAAMGMELAKRHTLVLGDPRDAAVQERAAAVLREVSALYVADPMTASRMLDVLKRLGLRVPGDISMVSFDNVSGCASLSPPVTSIAYPRHAMGAQAIEVLMAQLESRDDIPRTTTIELALIERESVGPCARSQGCHRLTKGAGRVRRKPQRR
ncbi:MAG: hypothetical protein A3K19_15395 [Lentisphaerae bacterium RIFOXYB12_FULL_65_16]|nr:MAG: hypothetical protein A3K18_26550 [Lentisphaerae bacterium RIFOXYA12_64_32]OGV88484.1 MAG: hypothetical protein A3K19_15395 [Lentisphaerae bacterium RIFOXYB12_FULL_65_16]